MLNDDIIYIFLLFFSVVCGLFVKDIPCIQQKQLLSTIIGFIIVFIVSGSHIIHPLILTFTNAFIVLCINKRFSYMISFVFCFGYLIFFRTTEYFGIPAPPAHTNAIQMILTLKMVGLANEVKAYDSLEKSSSTENPEKKFRKVQVNLIDIIHYSFCFAGVLIGPYYKYRTYWDMLNLPFIANVPTSSFLKRRISVVPFYIVLFLIGDLFFPLDFASSESILKESFVYRIFYMTPLFFNFRMRIYAGFVLGECVCISMGLGAYPIESCPLPGAGPTKYAVLQEISNNPSKSKYVEYNFEAVKNIEEYGSEFLPTIREGIRSWNRTVQYWLATFIYKKTNASKPIKMLITMLVSALWHGVHPGYYLCLLSAPLFLIVEAEAEKAYLKNSTYLQQTMFNWIWWIIKMQSFAYMGMAFLLLDIRAVLHYWRSVYFTGHIFILLIYGACLGINKQKLNDVFKKTGFIKSKKQE